MSAGNVFAQDHPFPSVLVLTKLAPQHVQITGWTLTGVVRSGSKRQPRITGQQELFPLWPLPATFISRPALLRGRGGHRPHTPLRGRIPARRFTRGCPAAAAAAARETGKPTGATWRSATTTRSTTHPWTVGATGSLSRRKSRRTGLKVRIRLIII